MSKGDAIWNKGYEVGKKARMRKTSQFTLAEIEQLLGWEAGNFTGSKRLRNKLLRIKRKLKGTK